MGRSQPLKQSPDSSGSETASGISGHIRAYPGISGHIRAYPGISGHRRTREAGRVPYRPSPDRVHQFVTDRIARRPARRYGWASRAVSSVAGSRAVRSVARSRAVPAWPVSATSVSLPYPRSDEPNTRRRPCPGPTARCSRRRHRRCTNMYSFPWLYRFMVARSAARLSAIVGPLSIQKHMPNKFIHSLTAKLDACTNPLPIQESLNPHSWLTSVIYEIQMSAIMNHGGTAKSHPVTHVTLSTQ